MSNVFADIDELARLHQARLAAAEEGCNARDWRFLGVHAVSGAWRAKARRRPARQVRALTFAEFVFAFLEAAEKREEELAERVRVKTACRDAGASFRGIHGEEERWVARLRGGGEVSAASGAELRQLLAQLPPKSGKGPKAQPAPVLVITSAAGEQEQLAEHHPYTQTVLEALNGG